MKGDMSDGAGTQGEMITKISIEEGARGRVRTPWIEVVQDLVQSHLQQEGPRIGLSAKRSTETVTTSITHIDPDRSENRAGIEDSDPDDLAHHPLAGQ